MKTKSELAETLANSTLYRDYERAYSEATGMPVCLRPVGSWKLPLHGKKKENSFCAIMASRSHTCAACMQMQESLSNHTTPGPITITCAYGLSETAVPVRMGDETIAFLQTGQVFSHKPSNAQFEKMANRVKELGVQVDRKRLEHAYFETPVVPERRMESVTHLLSMFADHLSMKSNQITIQETNSEPPIVTRARHYIQEHLQEDMTLGQVAKAVHTSAFYFCKLFKKTTGVNFTEYVSRLRVEKAKEMLLNPNRRVSEVAYEIGFQSLTHFNRVFRRIVGESPSKYRSTLPEATAL